MPGIVTRLLFMLLLLSPPQAAQARNDFIPSGGLVIDVRSEGEWKAGHLDNAILIPHDRIGTEIIAVAPARNTRLYLYCRSGRRTAIAAKTLTRAGYRNLINLGTMENAARVLKRPIVREPSAP